MKRLLFATFLVAPVALPLPAFPDAYEPVSQVVLKKAMECERAAANDIQRLTTQLEGITKERDELRIEVAKLHDAQKPVSYRGPQTVPVDPPN